METGAWKMKGYTQEDYKALYDMCNPFNDFAVLLRAFIEGTWRKLPSLYQRYLNPNGRINTFKRCSRKYFKGSFYLMYKISFEDLPLYMNVEDEHLLNIIKWRLSIGK
jgi:hypothetical protein